MKTSSREYTVTRVASLHRMGSELTHTQRSNIPEGLQTKTFAVQTAGGVVEVTHKAKDCVKLVDDSLAVLSLEWSCDEIQLTKDGVTIE